jgi:hypothetical protein
MCCFSRSVESVTNTNIFARSSTDNRQFLVYSMTLSTKEDLAMILPIPVPSGSSDDAVRFISLKDYDGFFTDMLAGFPAPKALDGSRSAKSRSNDAPKAALPVVEVGNFEASFVPSVQDFSRLDERFRLPNSAWDKLPTYRNYGFAVFKLKKGAQRIHPMAFEFPRANPKKLFFPTVHIHDGSVHPEAEFDHTLYCQATANETLSMRDWGESFGLAKQFMKVDKTQGIVAAESHCHKWSIRGKHKNEDMLV